MDKKITTLIKDYRDGRIDRRIFLKKLTLYTGSIAAAMSFIPMLEDGYNEGSAIQKTEELTWGKEPIESKTSRRATICLNGIWQVMPAIAEASQQPTNDWGMIRVPGGWQPGGTRMPGIVEAGTGGVWKGFSGDQVSRMWYQRTVNIPAEWAGQAVELEFERISTDARVFANGVECGKVHWPEGIVDITKAVKPGKDNIVRLLVVATPAATAVESLLAGTEPKPAEQQPAEVQGARGGRGIPSRGLIGNVLIHSRPNGTHIDNIYVKTSTRNKQLSLEVEIQNVKKAGKVHFTAVAMDEKGKEERRFETDLPVVAAVSQIVEPSWTWPDPRLWDLGQPNLYTLVLKVQGAGIDDEMAQTFGFREFWIDGPKYFLNGKEYRMRPVMGHPQARGVNEEVDGHIDAFMWAGYNFQEIWPNDRSGRGQTNDDPVWYDRADLKGWPITGLLEHISPYARTWNDYQTRERFRAAAKIQIKRYRNHPSIIMWNTSGNYGGGDQGPRVVGNRAKAWNTLGDWSADRFPKLQEAIEILRSLDGTRPVLSHHSGAIGDVYTLNFYFDLIPLQEREEWLSYWAAYGDMPYFIVEFGAPLQPTYHRGRDGFANSILTEPLSAEFTAIYFGSQVYTDETPQYRALIKSLFQEGQQYRSWQNNPADIFATNVQRIQELFCRNTWRSWRTIGNTGGMFPWDNGHGWSSSDEGRNEVDLGPFVPGRRGYYFRTSRNSYIHWLSPKAAKMEPGGKAIVQNNQPTLAWICGPGENPNPGTSGPDKAFTAKDHNFSTGQVIEKQVALLNDTRQQQQYSVRWEAMIGGQKAGSDEKQGIIEVSQTLFIPITFKAPENIGSSKSEGQITMSAKIGNVSHEDRFVFRVFGPTSLVTGKVAVYDTEGKTTRLLRHLGCSVQLWDRVSADKLIVVGRSALVGRPDLLRELEPLVKEGARAIVFIQDPEYMRNRLGLRVAWQMSRRAFPISLKHPVISGLEATDLSDWAGSSTLLEPYPQEGTWEKELVHPSYEVPKAYYGWRWGGRGAVASASIEKPHKGSWRPIIENEFDLAYTPLMELDYGKGRLIWCMLDLEDHVTKDPVASQLAGQIMQYAMTAPLSSKAQKTVYIGDDTGAKLLDSLGLLYEKAGSISSGTDLLVLGSGNALSDKVLSDYLRAGGKAVVLPLSVQNLPLGATQKKVDSFHGSVNVPDWVEARGLSQSDLRWRTDTETWLIDSGGDIGADGLLARKALGKGVLIYCQLDPDRFDADKKTYFRFTRWRQTRALCQVIANLGGTFAADRLIFMTVPEIAATQPWKFQPVKQPSDFYHPDYRDDFQLGDDPYRYYNW